TEAQSWFKKLQEQQPDSPQTLEIQARILKAQGNGRGAAELLERQATGQKFNLAAVARLLEELKEVEAAERMYNKYVESAREKQPQSVLVLAQFFCRHQRIEEALNICERAQKTCPPLAIAQTYLLVVSEPAAKAAHYERVERWLRAEIAKDPKSSSFSAILAHLRNLQGRYDEAEAIYRRAIAVNPRDTMALNNLAYLLALKDEKMDEALQRVQQAYEIVGATPSLMDTRALIMLKKGDREQAIKDLKEVTAERPSAEAYFHLAQAYYLTHNRPAARLAFRQAQALGMKVSSLHPLEKTVYEQLVRQLWIDRASGIRVRTQ